MRSRPIGVAVPPVGGALFAQTAWSLAVELSLYTHWLLQLLKLLQWLRRFVRHATYTAARLDCVIQLS